MLNFHLAVEGVIEWHQSTSILCGSNPQLLLTWKRSNPFHLDGVSTPHYAIARSPQSTIGGCHRRGSKKGSNFQPPSYCETSSSPGLWCVFAVFIAHPASPLEFRLAPHVDHRDDVLYTHSPCACHEKRPPNLKMRAAADEGKRPRQPRSLGEPAQSQCTLKIEA